MHYDRLLGVSAGSPNTEFIVPDKGVVNGTMTMQSREGPTVVEWSHVSNIALARPTQSVFTSFIDESEYTHILFGDQAAGRIPPVNAEIFLTYRTGVGVEANALAPDSLIVVKPEDTSLDLWGLTVKHPASPVGGTDPESIDAMRYSIPRAATRLKSRAITLNDYADLAMQVPGVAKSVASGTVYTSVHVHIAPTGGTGTDELMTQLCDNVERYLSDKIIVGSAVQAEPRPLSPDPDIEDAMPQLWQDVFVRVMVHVQESYSRTTVRRNVVAVLRQMLDFNNVDFGTRVSIGAIYRVGLAVQGVEWLDLFWLHTAAPTPSDLASGVWTDVGPHTVADIEPLETLIPKIDDVEVIETVANWPGFTDEELTHDGLWVQAVGGLPGS
jgi:hypothetical protein